MICAARTAPDALVVILPPEESPLATREFLYTAITRARQCVHVWGSEATVRAALGERSSAARSWSRACKIFQAFARLPRRLLQTESGEA
jgi:hypothetical protein